MKKKVIISDPTLRDGNHAVGHQLTINQISGYAIAAEAAGVPIVEVGHGNGLGASSLQVGLSAETDKDLLEAARKCLHKSKLGIHVIPGFATINKDLRQAIDIGVDVIRVAAHCTEADVTQRHISFSKEKGKEVFGVLMMSHLATGEVLLEESMKMKSYGADGVIIMDSAGAYLPDEVRRRIGFLVKYLDVKVGFHGHNNLGMAIANSLSALEAGAEIIDASARGFGAGAGNTQLEVLMAVLQRLDYDTGIDFYKVLDAATIAEKTLMKVIPKISTSGIMSGLAGVFSGFAEPVERISRFYNVDPKDVFIELGKRKIIAGQEDFIIQIASELQQNKISMK